MSVSVEEGKLSQAKAALAAATSQKAAAEKAAAGAEAELAGKQREVDDSQRKLLEEFGKMKDKVQLAKAQSEQAAEAERQAKVKVGSCEKSLAKVRKYCEECNAWEAKIAKLFDELDVDKSGTVSHNEFKKYIKLKDHTLRLQLGIGHWQNFLSKVDSDGNREISREEFIAYFTFANLDPIECWAALFDAIDTNGDGSLTKNELRNYSWYENPRVLTLLGFKDWASLMDTVDVDGSGTIERDEWLSFFAKREITGEYARAAKRQRTE